MLGLHNILLIASSQQAQNPHTISSDHHHQNNPPNLNSQDCNFNGSNNPWILNKCQELSIARKDGGLSVGDESSGSLGTCTDCGNKAKKECKYGRCRTCCKSRGYDCSTHVKSTWIPASKRQERHQVGGGGCSGSSSGGVKRPRIVSSSQNVTTTTTSNSVSSNAAAPPASLCFDTGSSQQDPSFKQSLPGKVKAPAVFRCIRVTAISGEEAEVLYQATVNICGHVFKGFLYNQGVDEKQVYPCISKVHLESSTNGREFSAPIVEPSDAYAASGNRKLFE